jgi:hypothetical protein
LIPRPWRAGAILVLLATALGILASRLVFTPVPWADGSAFYLPALELVHWPPHWRMHAQAAFVPSYDQANFNLMPLLPLLLGAAARSGLLHFFEPQLMIRILSLGALLAWAWLLWTWLARALSSDPERPYPVTALHLAAHVALAGLWDPILRWGTLVVRTETWIGLCWLWCLREFHRWEVGGEAPAVWNRTAWRISAGLAVAAYFHFEAVYLVPAAIVGLGFSPGWFKRLLGIGARTMLLLSPWLVYVALNFGLFAEQMQIQFFRLAHSNHWMSTAYLIFHSLFLEHGSPAGSPKFFNLAKAIWWLGLAALAVFTALAAARPRRFGPRRALMASAVAFVACFYLWATKAEVWFITLCHLAYWPWIGAAILATDRLLIRRALSGLAGVYAVLALAAGVVQARAISPDYTWPMYQSWVNCLERALGPLDAKPGLRLWQPHVPDVLVELSRRHPDWDLTRALGAPLHPLLQSAAGRAARGVPRAAARRGPGQAIPGRGSAFRALGLE